MKHAIRPRLAAALATLAVATAASAAIIVATRLCPDPCTRERVLQGVCWLPGFVLGSMAYAGAQLNGYLKGGDA
jgi:hypothetical protein